jgi:hypothetical protein
LRTSWLIVGMGGLDLLPALGRAVDVVRACACPVARPVRFWPRPTVRPPRSGVLPLARTGQLVEPDSSPLTDRRGHTTLRWPRRGRAWPLSAGRSRGPVDVEVHREQEQAQDTLGTADHSTRPARPGQSRVDVWPRTGPAGLSRTNGDRRRAIPGWVAARGRSPARGTYRTAAAVSSTARARVRCPPPRPRRSCRTPALPSVSNRSRPARRP